MRSISAKEYFGFCKNKSETMNELHKERVCFVYQTNYFVIETYVNVPGQPSVLRVETNNEKVELPPFLSIEKDIKHDSTYTSASLAAMKRV